MNAKSLRRCFASAGLAALLVLNASCNFTTANLSSLKVGKDTKVTAEADTFAPNETIYAVASASNVPSKVTVKLQTTYDELTDGKPSFHIEALDKSYELDKSSEISYYVSPPPKGWPTGKYHLTATLYVGSGEKKDEKTTKFTVKAP